MAEPNIGKPNEPNLGEADPEEKKLQKGEFRKAMIIASVVFACLLIIFVGIYLFKSGEDAKDESPLKQKALQCAQEKGITMYGAYWCSHCKNMKAEYGTDFYVECWDKQTDSRNELCTKLAIDAFPTFITAVGERKVGELTPEKLIEFAGCNT